MLAVTARSVSAIVAILGAALIATMTSTSAAAASARTTRLQAVGVRLINQQTERCLDSNADGAVYTLQCNGGSFQNWIWNGSTVIDAATGRCLDSNADGAVYTLQCNGGAYQGWSFDGFAGCPGTISDAATARNLDSNSQGNGYTLPNNCGLFQRWTRINLQLCPAGLPYLQEVSAAWIPFVRICGNAPNGASVISITSTSRLMIDVYNARGSTANITWLSQPESSAQLDIARKFDQNRADSSLHIVPPAGSVLVSATSPGDYVWVAADRYANLASTVLVLLSDYVVKRAIAPVPNLQPQIETCAETIVKEWDRLANQGQTFDSIFASALKIDPDCSELVDTLRKLGDEKSQQAERAQIADVTRQNNQELEREMDLTLREEMPRFVAIRP